MSKIEECIASDAIGQKVMIRSELAGVHFGELASVSQAADGFDVKILNSRRIYSWSGAPTISELAQVGSTTKDSKFSIALGVNYMRASEIMIMPEAAYENLNSHPPMRD